MNVFKSICCSLLISLMSYTAQAQIPCSGGSAAGYPCDGIDLMSFTPLSAMSSSMANDIWGWTSPNTGSEYVLLGLSDGTAFFNIDDPVNPVYLGKLPTHTSSSQWRDIKTYDNHAFIVSEAGSHGMQVFDLTQLDGVTSPQTWSNTAHLNYFGSAHNIVINEGSGYAYAVGAGPCSGGLVSVDISTPSNPTFTGCFSSDGYTHDAQCVNYIGPDPQYQGKEICFNSNENTLTIVDVTDKSDMTQISRTPYSGSRYTHQGWLTEDHEYFLMNDELDESGNGHNTRTYIWDLRDLDNPVFLGSYTAPVASIDHNLYIKDNLAYCSNYSSGLRVLNIANIAAGNLSEFAYFDTYTSSNGANFNGTWSNYPYFDSGVIAVSGIDEGLFLLRLQDAACADGMQNNGETGIDCGGNCAPCPTCSDGIQNGDETAIDCGGPDCAACPPCSGITLNLLTDDYAYETSWSIVDANGNEVASGGGYDGSNNTTFIESACLFDGCYDFVINDSFGDGICCGFGSGSYELVDDATGNVLASGGEFGSSETTNFCLSNAPTCAGVDLDINFDGFPTQTSWEITNDATGTVEISGGSYGSTLANSNLDLPSIACLPDGCYTLTFSDAVGNGMCPFRATATSGGTFISPGTLISPGSTVATLGTVVAPGLCGNYTLSDANGTELVSGGGSFGATEAQSFCLSGGVAQFARPDDQWYAKQNHQSNGLQIQPNVVEDEMTIVYNLDELADAQLFIIDINGKILQQHTRGANDEQQVCLNVSDLASGFYFVKLVVGDMMITEKFVKQ